MATSSHPPRRLPVLRERRTPAERRQRGWFRRLRLAVQLFFVAICVWSIWDFHRFTQAALQQTPGDLVQLRGPGFEAWTPIASLVSLVHWVQTGVFDPIHPAGLVILCGAVAVALVVRGGFCGWICPVGTACEGISRLGKLGKIRRESPPPRWLDLPLRSLRWLLLAFFGWGAIALNDYYFHVFDRYADVGMYGYWAWGRVGGVFLSLMAVAITGGLIVDRFWCRYLCPYGAFTSLLAKVSPWRVVRKDESCTACGKCDAVCPALLPVSTSTEVTSHRCIGCGLCVAECPEKHALRAEMRSPFSKRALRTGAWLTGSAVVVVFAVWLLGARFTGRWQTTISSDEYRRVIPQMHDGTFHRPHVMSRDEVSAGR